MKRPRRITACLLALAGLFLASTLLAQNLGTKMLDLLEKDYKPEAPLLPEGTKVVQEFKDVAAEAAGIVDFVENEAYVIHAEDQKTAYKAAKNNMICVGDTLVCEAGSKIVVLLKDQSQFTLAAYSKMTVDKAVYDPDRNLRDTVLDLAVGKARVVAKKLQEAGDENFKVKTPVATCGIRGSDFVTALVPADQLPDWRSTWLDRLGPAAAHAQGQAPPSVSVVVLTGASTTLSVTGLVGPTVIVSSNSILGASFNQPLAPPITLSPDQVQGTLNRVAPVVVGTSMPKVFE
jgi:hypothetical protein